MKREELCLDGFVGLNTLENFMELSEHLSQKFFSTDDLPLSYEGLLFSKKNNLLITSIAAGNCFTIIDYCWITILEQLNYKNVPLSFILSIKESFFQPIERDDLKDLFQENIKSIQSSLPEDVVSYISESFKDGLHIENNPCYFEILLIEAIIKQLPVFILIFEDGDWLPWMDGHDYLYSKEEIEKENTIKSISISVQSILKSFIKGKTVKESKLDSKGGLTVDKVRNIERFKNYTEKQAEEIIDALRAFSQATFQIYQKIKSQNQLS